MNKKRINALLPKAKVALEECGIAENGVINKTFRGQISSFGAAVVMGSLPAAVAFFSSQGNSDVERQNLMQAIYYCIFDKPGTPNEIFEYVCKNKNFETKGLFEDASIALKLAMNFYELKEKGTKDSEKS